MKPIAFDFETHAIEPRHTGLYPPIPVGVAVYDQENGEAEYYTGDAMRTRLEELWASGRELIAQNGKFDLEVAEKHFGLPWPAPDRWHDTMIMAFLTDCHADQLGLKWLAEHWCGMKPDEQDELHDWILANVPEATKRTAGAYISQAPVDLVAKYAIGDVVRTYALYDYCKPFVDQQPEAYAREMALVEVLVRMEQRGITVDYDRMLEMKTQLEINIEASAQWIRERLNAPDLELSKNAQLAKALLASDAIDKSVAWPTTPTGKPSTTKESVGAMITDKALVDTLKYHSTNSTMLGTFVSSWLEQCTRENPKIYCSYNQVRAPDGGTRTGRLSSTPNFQNLPTRFDKLPNLPEGLAPFPHIRECFIAPAGQKLISSDFDGQELHVFAHFENGQLKQKYIEDPHADLHQFAADLMSPLLGYQLPRLKAKSLAFTILYGAGPPKVAHMMGVTEAEARAMIEAYKDTVTTNLRGMNDIMRKRYKLKQPFKTLGGRLVKGEPPRIVEGRMREFSYKMMNYLVQGSSADQTKQAMVNFKGPGVLYMSVHDELVIAVDADQADEACKAIADCMVNALPLSLPMMATPKVGNNYGEIK